MTLEIKAEQGLERYTAYLDGRPIGAAQWILVRDTILLPHVHVDPKHADKGIGSLLMRRILDDARLQNRTALALCPYAKRWAQLHPDYRDTARTPLPGEPSAVRALLLAAQTSRTLAARGAGAAGPAAAGR
jgi:predicted GNAT family acetyltransferase